ncbi:uncharacterized protein LOC116169400 [Photinus pyralis]|uniref:uncharacterized protein LOC116169400 n=1 Tax=Photinus pyralis TaxID=7054 RepID=UPI0012672661|nr:uncharacterized protein LOC116169400 [Photinus pyralis]
MNYSIIQFEDGVEVVPDKWLVGENMCYWPPMNSDKLTLHKLVLSKANVEKNWVQYKILKIFCHADTYQRAVQKLKLALEMSDIDTSDESLKKTRHSRHHKVADEFDESDVDHFTPSFIPNERKKEKKRRPSPLDSDEDDVEACPEMSSKLPPFPSSANFTLVENRKNNTADDEILPIRNSVPQQCMSMSRASTPSSVTNTRVSIRGTDEILMKLNTLLSITKIIENRLTLIERSVSNLQGEGNAKAPSSSCMEAKEFNKMFPLTSEVDLLNFEEF